MGIIGDHLTAVITNPDRDLADRLAWLNDDEDNDLENYPGLSWQDGEPYRPTAEEEADEAGYALGWDGEPAPAVTDLTLPTPIFTARVRGWIAGRCGRAYHDELARLEAIDEEQEEIEYNAWLDGLAREREAELMLEDAQAWHEAERCQAVGSVEHRKG